jgi:hypothetical protein
MNLQRSKVAVIRGADESAGFLDLPNREFYTTVRNNNQFDIRGLPALRQTAELNRWLTQMMIMADFIDSNHQHLLVIETTVNLQSRHVEQIEKTATAGINLYSDDASVYLIDKATAEILLKNNRIFYAPLSQVLLDLQKLALIKSTTWFTIEKKISTDHLPIILVCVAAALLLLAPTYGS